MRTKEMMSAAAVTLAGLGVLVGVEIGSGQNAPKLIAQRTQPDHQDTLAHSAAISGVRPGATWVPSNSA